MISESFTVACSCSLLVFGFGALLWHFNGYYDSRDISIIFLDPTGILIMREYCIYSIVNTQSRSFLFSKATVIAYRI
jgi:hypothetical protein